MKRYRRFPPNNTITPPDPEPELWVVRSESIETGLIGAINGELTEEDEGRDWFSFEGERGEHYIIELRNQMEFAGGGKHVVWWTSELC